MGFDVKRYRLLILILLLGKLCTDPTPECKSKKFSLPSPYLPWVITK